MSASKLQKTSIIIPNLLVNQILIALLGGLMLVLGGCASDPVRQSRVPVEDRSTQPETVPGPVTPRPTPGKKPSARDTVVLTAQSMLGRPYRYGGTGPRSFDCSGLVWFSYGRAGIDIPRTAQQQFHAAQRIRRRQLEPGDLIFFDIGGTKISHVGIYVGEGEFVHAPSSGKQVSMESLDNPYWRDRIIGTGHYF